MYKNRIERENGFFWIVVNNITVAWAQSLKNAEAYLYRHCIGKYEIIV